MHDDIIVVAEVIGYAVLCTPCILCGPSLCSWLQEVIKNWHGENGLGRGYLTTI